MNPSYKYAQLEKLLVATEQPHISVGLGLSLHTLPPWLHLVTSYRMPPFCPVPPPDPLALQPSCPVSKTLLQQKIERPKRKSPQSHD